MDRKMGTTDGTLEKIVENTTQNQEQGGKQDVWKLGNHTFTSLWYNKTDRSSGKSGLSQYLSADA